MNKEWSNFFLVVGYCFIVLILFTEGCVYYNKRKLSVKKLYIENNVPYKYNCDNND